MRWQSWASARPAPRWLKASRASRRSWATRAGTSAIPTAASNSAGEREFRIAAELGIETAVTTQKGLLYPEHVHELTALPRLSLNGDFQDMRYVKALLSGVPFALMNTLKRYAGARPAP